MTRDSSLAERTRALTLELTGWPSVSETRGEADFAPKLRGLMAAMPYFRANPAHLELLPVEGDPWGRASVAALVKGSGRRTVILTGHFDVVPVDGYGDLAGQAFDPAALAPRLIERLRTGGDDPLALADLESGEYLPGRGILDMKSGDAAGIAVLEHFASSGPFDGNVLFLCVPDEEVQSAGMRSAVTHLAAFARRHDLDYVLGVNLDAISDHGDGSAGQVIAEGSIGKLLLSALVVGKEAHACYPQDGVSAAYLAAELVAELEFAPELAEETGTEIAAPPTVLGLKDLKPGYNVTTPARVSLYWNTLQHRRSPEEVFAVAAGLAERAMLRARTRIAERAARLTNRTALSPAWDSIPVTDFRSVHAEAAARDAGFAAAFATEAERLSGEAALDVPTRSLKLAEFAWNATAREGPAVVLSVGAMPYPAVRLEDAGLSALLAEAAAEAGAAFGTRISTIRYFPGISDMSFLGSGDPGSAAFVAAQSPLGGSRDLPDTAWPGVPVVNAGPWGRDYHHRLERVNLRYAFEVLPELLLSICRKVLRG